MATFSEFAKTGEEMFLAYFMVLIQHLPGKTGENNVSQGSQCLSENLKMGYLQCYYLS
jgi:hypothetical protein